MLVILELSFIVLLFMILGLLYRNEKILAKKASPHAKIEEYWNGMERRRYARFREILEAMYKIEKRPHLKTGKTVDISEGGVKLLLDEKLAKGTIIDLQIAFPNSKKSAEVEGEVVWTSEYQEADASIKRLFHSGVKFLAINQPQGTNLIDYIRSLSEDSKS